MQIPAPGNIGPMYCIYQPPMHVYTPPLDQTLLVIPMVHDNNNRQENDRNNHRPGQYAVLLI